MRNELTTRTFDFPSFDGRFPSLFNTKAYDGLFDALMRSITEDKWNVDLVLGNTSGLPCDLKVINDDQGNPLKTVIEYAIAGYSDNDVLIEVDDDNESLNISVEKVDNEEDKNAKFLQKRISKRSFKASYNLTGIDSKAITATTQDGVLKITLPHVKTEPKKSKTRQIELNTHKRVQIASGLDNQKG